MSAHRPRYLIEIIALFAAYFLTAWLGLKVGAVSTFATLVWPPTGIALAALMIGGTRLWPGIALGAFLVNWFMGASPLVALGIGIGNTLEAVLGASLLRWIGFQRSMERLQDVFALAVLAAFLSTLVSATFGATSLFIGGAIQGEAFRATWTTWWFGDVMGDLVVAPFLFVWSGLLRIERTPLLRVFELAAFGVAIVMGGLFFLTNLLGTGSVLFPHAYLIFPLLMVVATRLDQRWTVTAIFTITAVTLWAAASGHGRFQADSLSLRLFQAQIFLGVVALSKMVLAAAVMERREREKENARLYREAHEAVLVRDEFLSIASHELKTPLSALSLQLQIFNHSTKKILAGREKQPESERTDTIPIPLKTVAIVSACENQCKKLATLLDNLLDLTRIRLGKLELTRENVNFCEVVKAVIEQFRTAATEKGGAISVRCDPVVIGFWDRTRVEQVVTNLISNALKYGERSPISVVVEKDEVRRVSRLIVQDQGMGIRPEMIEKVFERFERAGIGGHHISGLGLGLYICRQIVKAHGGQIRVESEWGKGSKFIVELPA